MAGNAEHSGPDLLRSAHLLDGELSQKKKKNSVEREKNVWRKRGSLCFALEVCYPELADSFVFWARHTRSDAAPNRTGGLPGSMGT